MKIHLPLVLRAILIAAFSLPVQAVLSWNSGEWNTVDSSWLRNGESAVFSNGDAVAFTSAAASAEVNISGLVEPSSMLVSGSGFVFRGSGSISGTGTLTLGNGASLSVQNANTFSGGTHVAAQARLTLGVYDGVGTVSSGELALGNISGDGRVVIALQDASTMASIQGSSLADFTGTLYLEQGYIGLGRRPDHSGPGSNAVLGAARVDVGGSGRFIVSLGGGQAALDTGNSFSPDIRTENGAVIGNRDGHVNWLGNVSINLQDVTAAIPVYDASAVTELSMYYGKYVVWNGVVAGDGVLQLTSGQSDTGTDHRLVLTNGGNSFQGTYRIAASYLTTLALAGVDVATDAGVELNSENSRLVLMSTSAGIRSLNGTTGVVQAEGTGALQLSIQEGDFQGTVRDSANAAAGLSLGLIKAGSGALSLNGENCTYTGVTQVQAGVLQYSGNTTLGSLVLTDAAARLEVSGNLTLRGGAGIEMDVDNLSGAPVQVGDSFSLAGASCAVRITGYESLTPGSYALMTWGAESTVSSGQFIATGLNDTAEYIYSVQVQGNQLAFVVGNMADMPWLWNAGSAAWTDDSSVQWSNASAAGPAGQEVTFSARNAGTVTIGSVTPSGISVNGGVYTFVPASADAAGIVSSGTLRVNGADTVLNLNLDNTSFAGNVALNGGVLVMGTAQALGDASLYFNGGVLRYGSGVATDVSSQVNADSLGQVRVDTNGNEVTWSASSGVQQTLSRGVEKSGLGMWTLDWNASGEVQSGALSVQDGTLSIRKQSGNGTFAGTFSGAGTIALSSPSGQLTVSGNNSAFGGTLLLRGDGNPSSGSVSFASGASMGGADTLVQVAGQRFWFADSTSTAANLEIVEGTTTYFDGSTGRSYTFTGTVSGGGNLLVKPSSHITMSGDISVFTGQFEHPGASASTWLLGGEGVSGSGLVQANLSSNGSHMVYAFWYETPTTMSGRISGTANLQQRGSGALILTAQNTTTGNLTIDAGCEVRLGSATAAGSWAGAVQLGEGVLTLVNGFLQTPLTTREGTLVADVAAGAVVDIAGMDGNTLQSISVGAGGLLSGIVGNLTIGQPGGVESLYLTLGVNNVSKSPLRTAGVPYLLEIQDGSLQIADSTTVTLDMETIRSILEGQRQAVYLHLTNAEIELQNGIGPADLFANSPTSPEALGLVVLGIDGGSIVLEGAVRDVYMVMENGDYDTVTSYTRLQDYKATFIDSGYTLHLNLPGDNTQQAWVNNLLGAGDVSISNTDEASGVVRVLLNNDVLAELDGVLSPEEEAQVNTANTELQGNISCGKAVQLVKTGTGTLSIGGALTADWLEISEGTLRLSGTGSVVNTLHGDAALVVDGELEISGNALAYSGALSGDGALNLTGRLNGRGSVGALKGSGELLASGAVFTVKNVSDAMFSGSLLEGNGEGVLSVQKGAGSFTLNQANTTATWSIHNAGRMNIILSGAGDNSALTLASLSLSSGSSTLFVLDTDKNTGVFSLAVLQVADDAEVTLQSSGALPLELAADGTLVLGEVGEAELGEDGRVPLTLGGSIAFQGIEEAWLSVENGQLLLNTQRDESNRYASLARSANGRVGSGMLWAIPNSVLREAPDLSALSTALNLLSEQGRAGEGDALLAAAAGAGAAVLGAAVLSDVERQLRAIRNRTTSMGIDPRMEYDELPICNAWVNAEGDRHELRASGTAAGYTLSSWGATVGADFDFSPTFTAGLAMTGMYGELSGRSPDDAHGDTDIYYISMLARYVHHRWTHTWLGTFGWGNISLRRQVNWEGGGYRTKGNTDSTSFGAMYELGYVIPLDEDNQSCLQPVANISYRYAHVDAYAEKGSDAALHMGAQSMDGVSFGLGARVQTYALENEMNRQALLEARMLVKMDAGERRNACDVALNALRARSGRVHSAEVGWLGMEIGAGISIPIGVNAGFLFLDAGFEFRADATDWNGTVGYRFTF